MKMVFEIASFIEQEQSRSVALVSSHTLKPLDVDGISGILKKFETVVVVEEHSERGGLGAQVKQIAWEIGATCKLHTFSLKDEFIHFYGSQVELWEAHGLSARRICKRIHER